MVRLLAFLIVIAAAAFGLAWLADNPGQVTMVWRGVEYRFSLMVGLGFVAVSAVVLSILWAIVRFVFRVPSLMSFAARARRREKGLRALSRGMIAVGAGDARAAAKHSAEAQKLVGHEPMTRLLRAQAAQLRGDRPGAVTAFNEMLEHDETRGLGLRGLHIEARRAGEHEAALAYAERAHRHVPAPWAGQAMLEDRARRGDWQGALQTVEANAAAGLIDKPTATRWRAVLKTAIAGDLAERDPKAALALAQEALKLAPGLVPAAALAGRLAGAQGDYRKASRLLEAAYEKAPHPDLAAAYIRLRHGDSVGDRLARARVLKRYAHDDPETALTIGRAALEAHDLAAARAAVAPLIAAGAASGRPTRRVCLLVADIEDAAGDQGAVREWLGRAARAPRDKAWIAEGVITDRWAPVSPSGALDAFVWRAPDERLAPAIEPAPPPPAAEQKPMLTTTLADPPLESPPKPPVEVPPAPPPEVPPEQPPPPPSPPSVAIVEPLRRVSAAPAPPAFRTGGLVLDPLSTPPDDPGPIDLEARRRDYDQFAARA